MRAALLERGAVFFWGKFRCNIWYQKDTFRVFCRTSNCPAVLRYLLYYFILSEKNAWKYSAFAKSSRPSVLSRNTYTGLTELKQRHHCMNILIYQHVFQILSKKRWLCLKSKNVLSDLKISALNCFSLIKLG